MSTHLRRICSVIDHLPSDLNFDVFQRSELHFAKATGISQVFGGLLSELELGALLGRTKIPCYIPQPEAASESFLGPLLLYQLQLSCPACPQYLRFPSCPKRSVLLALHHSCFSCLLCYRSAARQERLRTATLPNKRGGRRYGCHSRRCRRRL